MDLGVDDAAARAPSPLPRVSEEGMSYLAARRYGLTHAEPNETERQGGWRQVWEHPSGLRAAKHPVTGRWHVIDGTEMVGEGFSSSLRACAAKIERLIRERQWPERWSNPAYLGDGPWGA
jgi:hypothetical protein